MSEKKKHFYKTLNNIVATNMVDNEEAYIINDYIGGLEMQLQQKENIIKEVREYIDKNKASLPMGRDEFTCEMRYSDPVVLARKVLEILDKENRL